MKVSGSRVLGSGSRVLGLGCGDWGSGFRDLGLLDRLLEGLKFI